MHVRNARLATLALATAFFAAACGGKTDAPAATAGAEGAAAQAKSPSHPARVNRFVIIALFFISPAFHESARTIVLAH